VKAALGYFP